MYMYIYKQMTLYIQYTDVLLVLFRFHTDLPPSFRHWFSICFPRMCLHQCSTFVVPGFCCRTWAPRGQVFQQFVNGVSLVFWSSSQTKTEGKSIKHVFRTLSIYICICMYKKEMTLVIYIYIYVYMYICVYIYMRIYIYIYMTIHEHI